MSDSPIQYESYTGAPFRFRKWYPSISTGTGFNTLASVTVNPLSTGSKILVSACFTVFSNGVRDQGIRITKNGTIIQAPTSPGSRIQCTGVGGGMAGVREDVSIIHFIDTAGTTSPITYNVEIYRDSSTIAWEGSLDSLIAIRLT